jgi:signal transduction histidine kinase
MSGNFWLDWILLAVSIFDVIVTLWLGLMILFSAERRTWGVYLAASGLLAGSLFFISHAALLGQNIAGFTFGVNFWWHLGWAPIIFAPFVWYIVMLWFAGYWEEPTTDMRQRHRPWLSMVVLYLVLLVVLLVFLNPIGDLTRTTNLSYVTETAPSGIPVLFIAYPIFILLCISLAMDALLRPGPSNRLMAKDARTKARPWLVGSSFILLVTSGIVGFTIGWVVENARRASSLPELYGNIAPSLAWFDLILSLLVTGAILLIGQSIVSYEIFTGKPLPRRGFRQQWLSALLMAGVVALFSSFVFQSNLHKIYLLIISAALVAVFFALFSWRYSEEREEFIRQIRPFLGSRHLTANLLDDPSAPFTRADIRQQYIHLVRDVLNLEQSAIHVVDKLAGMDIPSLEYPAGDAQFYTELLPLIPAEARLLEKPLALERETGTAWLVPLWSQRGLDAYFLLGSKSDDSFLSQEEIEIARSAGEQIIDLLITAELVRRLVQLQRERFTEQALMDQVPRRVIHDEIIPQIHSVILELSSAGTPSIPPAIDRLGSVHKQLSKLLREMPAAHPEELRDHGLVYALRMVVEREYPGSFRQVAWEMDDLFEEKAGSVSEMTREVVFYAAREAIRNSAKYARTGQTAAVDLIITGQTQDRLTLIVEDNGQGFDQTGAFIAGHGLDLHSLMMTIVGGSLQVESRPGAYTRVKLEF